MRTRPPNARVALAAIGLLACVLAGCSGATKSGDASTPPSDDGTSASATTSIGETTTASTQAPSAGLRKIGDIAEGELTPGRYALSPVGPLDEPLAVVDIPAGYGTFGPFIYADKPAEPEDPLAIGLWDITGVYLSPCAQSNETSPTSVVGIFDALAGQRLTSSTRPREVDVAGYHGLYIEVTTPTDLDYSGCDDAEVNLWSAHPDGGYWTRTPGMVNRLWILDVDGKPMAIHMAVPPSATRAQIDQLTGIVDAATFQTS